MKRMWTIPAVIALVLAGLIPGCGKKGDQVVLADVGDRHITVADYWSSYNGMKPDQRPALDTPEARSGFLNDLVAKQIMEMSALEKYPELNEQQQWRLDRVRRQELTNAVKKRLINDQIRITPEMKDKIYENSSRERRFKAMLVEFPEAAEYVRDALRHGESFEELAQAYSVSWVGPENMGDIGWREAGVFPFPLDTLAWSADIGDTLGPFDYPLGHYIIVVSGERPHELFRSREDMDAELGLKILQPLHLNRQKAMLDSLRQAADPYYPADALALLMTKFFWEIPPDQVGNPYARLDAQRVIPTFTAEQESIIVIDFKNAPDWTAREFTDRLSWYPMGLWPTGQSEGQLIESIDLLVRDYLWLKAAEDLGIPEDPEFQARMNRQEMEMRVNFFYYNDILGSFEPSDEEVRAFFEENRERYKAPPSYKVAVFASSDKELIDRLGQDWKNGMSYQDLRAKYEPKDASLETIGESPWLYEGEDLRRDSVVATLKEGGVSETLVDPGTAMVVKLVARRPERLVNYDEIKEDVQEEAKTAITDQKLGAFLDTQKEKYGVTIHTEALEDLGPPPVEQGE